MDKKIKILHLEDLPADAMLINNLLKKANLDFEIMVVDNKNAYINALSTYSPDLVLSDHSLPSFDSKEALTILQQTRLKIPFILVTATLHDDFAVDIIKKGADDYILKDRLQRLPNAIENALEKTRLQLDQEIYLDELIRNEHYYRALIENSADAVIVLSKEGKPLYISPSVHDLLGYTEEEALQLDLALLTHPDDAPLVATQMETALQHPGKPIKGLARRIRHKDGSWRWLEATYTNMLHDSAIAGIVDNFYDITDIKETEKKLINAKRLYAFISQLNQAIVHVKDKQSLFEEVCRIAVHEGKFKMAWVGIPDGEKRLIKLTASCGALASDLDKFEGYRYELNGPIDKTIKNQEYCVENVIQKDPEMMWKEYAELREFNSVICLALKEAGNVVAILIIYASEINYFDAEDILLLAEATDDISFALDVFVKDALKFKAEKALAESEANLQAIFENTSDGFILTDLTGIIKTFNSKFKDIILLNVGKEIRINDSLFDFIPTYRKGFYDGAIARVQSGEVLEYDFPFERENGEIKWFTFTINGVLHNNELTGISITAADITERKNAALQLQESEVFNKGVLSSLVSHIAVINNHGTVLTVNKAWNDFATANGATNLERVSEGSNYFDVCEKAILNGEPLAKEALVGIKSLFENKIHAFELEYPCHSNNEERWFVLHVSNFGVDGTRVVISHQDVTQRKVAKQKLLQSEIRLLTSQANLNAVIENTDSFIYSLDRDCRYVIFNKALQEGVNSFYGINIKPGDHVFDFINQFDPLDATHWTDAYSRALTGEIVKFEKEIIYNGLVTYTSFSMHPIWEKDSVIGLSCFALDITQQKETSKALKESEFRYRQIVETAQEGIWMIDENNETTFVNRKMCEILEYTEEEMLGKENFYFMEEDQKQIALATRERRKKGLKDTIIMRLNTKNGKTIWVNISSNPIFDDDGNYKGALGMVSDVTEKKMADEMLQLSEQQYRKIAIAKQQESARLKEAQAVANVGSWETDLQTLKTTWSDQTHHIFETDPATFQATHEIFLGFIHPEDRDKVNTTFKNSFSSQNINSIEHRIIGANGSQKYVIENWKVFLDGEENPVRAAGTCQDITAIKLTENQLHDTSDKLQKTLADLNKILDSSLDVICTINTKGEFINVSAASELVWGYTPAELIGTLFMNLVYAEDNEITVNAAEQIANNIPVPVFENRYIHKSGKVVYLLWSINWDEKLKLMFCIAKDVTEKKKLEKAIVSERDQFLDMFSTAPSAIAILKGPHHIFEMANPVYLQVIGRKNVIGKTAAAVIPEVIEQGFIDLLDAVYATGESYIGKETLVKLNKSGEGTTTEVYLNFIYQAYRDDQGKIDGIFFFGNDVTEQIQSRKEIEKSEKFFKGVIENSDDMITVLGPAGNTIYASPAVSKKFGYTMEECLNLNLGDVVHPDDALKMQEFVTFVMKQPRVPMECPLIRNRKKDGSYIWVVGTLTNFFETEGINAIVANFRDVTENKKLEDLLAKSNKLAAIGSFEIDVDKGTVFWSDMVKEIREVEPDFVPQLDIGINYFKGEAHQDIISQKVKDCIDNGTPWDEELEIITFKGNTKWVRTIGEGEFINGKCMRIYGSFQDIDSRKKAEIEALKVYEEKNIILESIADGFFAVDKNWIVTYWNNHAEKMLMIPKSEILGKLLWDLFPENAKLESFIKYHEAVETNLAVHFEDYYAILKKWYEISAYPSNNGLSVYFKDITDRKIAEEQIRFEKNQLRTLIDNLPDAIYFKDDSARKIVSNKFDYNLLGKEIEAGVLGKTDLELLPDQAGRICYNHDMQILKTGKALVDFEESFLRNDGKLQWLITTKVPLRNEQNEIIGLLGIGRDITDKKIAEKKLTVLNKELKKNVKQLVLSNAELEQFAYVASHDLQEPLRMVTSFLSQIEKKYGELLDDKGREYIYFAVDGAKRMRQIILDLLEFSKIGSTTNHREKVSLDNLIKDIVTLFQKKIKDTHAKVEFQDLPVITTYFTPLRQVFFNLIGNALKYQDKLTAPHVIISSKEFPRHWEFAVKDNGIGIEKEYFSKIFIIFQRLHNKDDYSGTGMGLAICKKIVENWGGKIWIESEATDLDKANEPAKGSTFFFTVPKKLK